ncbi:hypothetical protein NSS82_19165 [Paenibacillus sp. FSL H7-0735]|uniref:hypothetical protein n=1 Tax=Paenibacillus sp. FSL H7-0735 TaxID=2954736 RepID=UPI0030FA82A8
MAEYQNNEIIKVYRDKKIIFSLADLMTNKLNPKQYKINLRLIPLNVDNKANKEGNLDHYLDVLVMKRVCFHILNGSLNRLFNKTEDIRGKKIPCYKDMKGTITNGHVLSRIFTLSYDDKGNLNFKLSEHSGKQTDQGAITPTSGPIRQAYIALTPEEAELVAIGVQDYMNQKEIIQFKQYHMKTITHTANNQRKINQITLGAYEGA